MIRNTFSRLHGRMIEDYLRCRIRYARMVRFSGMCLLLGSVSGPALAASGASVGLVQMLQNIGAIFKAAGPVMIGGLFLAGLGAAAWGAWAATIGRRKRQAQEESPVIPIMSILGGMFLMTILVLTGSVSQALYGTNQVSTSALTNGGF